MLLRNSVGEDIQVYCVLDSDCHTPKQKENRVVQATRMGICLHIWKKNDIENYFLIPSAIHEVIRHRVVRGKQKPSIDDIRLKIEETSLALRDDVFDGLSQEILAEERKLGAGGANQRARTVLEEFWSTFEGRLSAISGKIVL
jgi:hypothetical protein